jgi:hypothetical protein
VTDLSIVYAHDSVPYSVSSYFREKNAEELSGKNNGIVNLDSFIVFQKVTLTVGMFLACLYFVLAVLSWLRRYKNWCAKHASVLSHVFASSNERGESRLKLAAARKLKMSIANALVLQQNDVVAAAPTTTRKSSASFVIGDDLTMRNFVLRGERYEMAGGFFWTWRRLLNGDLFQTEGIWLNTRLLVLQLAQVLVAAVYSFILLRSVVLIADRAEKTRAELNPGLPQFVYDLVPTRRMVYIALYPASITAICVMTLLILIYIPRYFDHLQCPSPYVLVNADLTYCLSAVSTVLKYRCHFLPSLGSPYFNKYRVAVDCVSLLIYAFQRIIRSSLTRGNIFLRQAYMNTANAIYVRILFYMLGLGLNHPSLFPIGSDRVCLVQPRFFI